MSIRRRAFALVVLIGIGWGAVATHQPVCSSLLKSPSTVDLIVVSGAAAARAHEPTLLTGTVMTAPAADSCAGGGTRYLLISRHGRVRLCTHRPKVDRLLARVAGRSIPVMVAGHPAFDPRCPRFEVEAAWLRQPRPEPMPTAMRST